LKGVRKGESVCRLSEKKFLKKKTRGKRACFGQKGQRRSLQSPGLMKKELDSTGPQETISKHRKKNAVKKKKKKVKNWVPRGGSTRKKPKNTKSKGKHKEAGRGSECYNPSIREGRRLH